VQAQASRVQAEANRELVEGSGLVVKGNEVLAEYSGVLVEANGVRAEVTEVCWARGRPQVSTGGGAGRQVQGDLGGTGLEEFWTADDIVIAPTTPLREKGERGRNFVKEDERQLVRSVLHVS
jgi:hypothetical protein